MRATQKLYAYLFDIFRLELSHTVLSLEIVYPFLFLYLPGVHDDE